MLIILYVLYFKAVIPKMCSPMIQEQSILWSDVLGNNESRIPCGDCSGHLCVNLQGILQ